MKKSIIFILSCALCCVSFAQEANFNVNISSDSVLMDNYLKVTFSVENAKATDFSAPDFEGFEIVSGPNMSSSYSMINGEVSQSVSYSYYLKPVDIGNYYIAPASVRIEDGVLETMPLEVIVLSNPDGIIQQPKEERERPQMDMFRDFTLPWNQAPIPPVEKKKKKRKIYKL